MSSEPSVKERGGGPRRRLATVLLLAFVVVALVPTVTLAVFSSATTGQQNRDSGFDKLGAIAASKSEEVVDWLATMEGALLLNLNNAVSYLDAVDVLTQEEGSPALATGEMEFVSYALSLSEPDGPFNRVMVANLSGEVVLTTDSNARGWDVARQAFYEEGRTQTYNTVPLSDPLDGEQSVYFSTPVSDPETGELLGVLIARSATDELERIALDRTALGETGEVLLATAEGGFVADLRFGERGMGVTGVGVGRALSGVDGQDSYNDYRGEEVLGVYRWLAEAGMGLVVKQDVAEVAPLNAALVRANIIVALGAAGAALLIGALLTRRITSPITDLTERALRIAEGERIGLGESEREDEIGTLATTFGEMATRMWGVVDTLEERVAIRARDLETIFEINQAITRVQNLDTLLKDVVRLIRDRFGFYHAQVFLLDEQGEYAVLRASTGDAGRTLLEQKHRLQVGSQSVIGRVTGENMPIIARDTDPDQVHRRNELLPDTHAEMALPLRIGERVIGALDVQSTEADAFLEENVRTFQTMADQLAIALDNARLFAESEAALAEVETLNRQLTGQAWGRFVSRKKSGAATAFRLEEGRLLPVEDDLHSESLDGHSDVSVVLRENGEGGGLTISIPIQVRGEVIGAFEFGGDDINPPSADDIALIEAITDRVVQALENRRLFEQTQRLAHREQLVNQITSRIVGSTDVGEILQTTVKELGKVLRSPKTSIQLYGEEEDE